MSKLIGMGFNGATTFSGKRSNVQARVKRHSPHTLSIATATNSNWLAYRLLMLLVVLNMFKSHLPQHGGSFFTILQSIQSLKEVLKVLDLLELKIVKPSDTCWLAHEKCVQAVKASYNAVVACLDHIYTDSHEPKALGLKKILCNKSTVTAIYLLDYILPQLSKAKQGSSDRKP